MHILSASVKNYRIHDDLTVEFGDELTLVGGHNESGKSTLVEAIHRALFLRAAIGGKVQKEMQPRTGGHPEVCVRFEQGGSRWEITKLFSGTNGRATLAEEGGKTLQNAEAEAKLAALLQVEEAGGGTGGANLAKAQWSHLWVWQGLGGDDPAEHAAAQRSALLSRLKDEGGGAAMQSDLDARVAEQIQEQAESLFNKNGSAKAGSDLKAAEDERDVASEEANRAESAFDTLEAALEEYATAEKTIAQQEEQTKLHRKSLTESRERLQSVTKLKHQIELESNALREATTKHEQIARARSEIVQLRGEIATLAEKAKPVGRTIDELETKLEQSRKARASLENDSGKAEQALASLRENGEFISAWGQLLKAQEERAELLARKGEIDDLREKQQTLDAELAALPTINADFLQKLRSDEAELSEAEAVLRALATGVEVIRAEESLQIGEQTLTTGDREIVEAESLLQFGNALELRITPGGGTDLIETRRRVQELKSEITIALRNAGAKTAAEASDIFGKRQQLTAALATIATGLKAREAASVTRELEDAEKNLITNQAEVERRTTEDQEEPPATVAEARDRWSEAQTRIETAKGQAAAAREQRETGIAETRRIETELTAARSDARESEHALIAKKAQLETMTEPLGSEEEQAKLESTALEEREKAAKTLTKTQSQLAELQPDGLDASVSQYEGALSRSEELLALAREQRAAARRILARDGSSNPAAELETARARAVAAEERYKSLQRRAAAIQLLHERFANEQQQLSDRFSRPLADKVTQYLQQIFGASATATVSTDGGEIGGWSMTRDGSTFDFGALSGGTREQVASAVRLAMAEILAADYGGKLPVVFDDAFTNSDPDRVASLQRMLYLASRNGLQIIVLTCDPIDYSGLGAKTVSISR